MANEKKRYSISFNPPMKAALEAARKKSYPTRTKGDMIRDLIARGLKAQGAVKAGKTTGDSGHA